jgi:pimeloyl-ACP methyl ester carboxylesterase
VRALVTIGGYNVQNTVAPPRPASAEEERAAWYQWYFNTERGRLGLEKNRREICRLLWRDWSPGWRFDDATFEQAAAAFDNPDFVPVVIHSYRHRHRHAPGDPRFDAIEARLAQRPRIEVPSVILHGADDAVDFPSRTERHPAMFPDGTERHVIPDAGHFLPREQPGAVVDALLPLLARTAR